MDSLRVHNGGAPVSYGIEFIGDNGGYLIDGELPDLAGIDGGVFSFSSRTPGGYFWTRGVNIPNRGDSFVVAVKVPDGVEVSCLKRRFSPQDGYIPEVRAGFDFYASSNVSIEYRVFWGLSALPPTNESYGMRVWGPSGRLIFDSGHRLFSLVGRSSITSDGTRSYPGGRKGQWMVIDTTGTVRRIGAPGGGYQEMYFTGVTRYSSTYRTRSRLYSRTGPWSGVSGLPDQGPSYSFMNLDVE